MRRPPSRLVAILVGPWLDGLAFDADHPGDLTDGVEGWVGGGGGRRPQFYSPQRARQPRLALPRRGDIAGNLKRVHARGPTDV